MDAPPVDGPYKTLYNRFRRWSHNSGFLLIFSALARSDGAEPEEVLMLDTTYLKAHRTASRLNKGVGGTWINWANLTEDSSKLHVVCDQQGRPVQLHLSEGQWSDFTGVDVLLRDLPGATSLMGDKRYDGNKIRTMLMEQASHPVSRPSGTVTSRFIPARGRTQWTIRWKTCWPNARTGTPLQPAMTAVPIFSALPSSWLLPSSSGYESCP